MISRIDAIIRSLRQFTRRAELEISLHAVDLAKMFSAAQELLSMRHRPLQTTLVLPQLQPQFQAMRSEPSRYWLTYWRMR